MIRQNSLLNAFDDFSCAVTRPQEHNIASKSTAKLDLEITPSLHTSINSPLKIRWKHNSILPRKLIARQIKT